MSAADNLRQVQLVGRKLRQLRQQRKLTRDELAARIGLAASDLVRIEKGEYRVSLDILFSLLAEFQVSPEEFFTGLKRPPSGGGESRDR